MSKKHKGKRHKRSTRPRKVYKKPTFLAEDLLRIGGEHIKNDKGGQ